MANKVKFGLKNVHIAVRTVAEDGTVTYEKPFHLPGAVNISMPPKGDKIEFYADDEEYYKAYNNQGYEGTLEIALVTDEFKEKILKETADKNGVIFENSEAIFSDFALLFEFKGDKNKTRHVFYNVSVERPDIESGTKTASVDIKTETLNMTASANPDGNIKASAGEDNSSYLTWYDTVYEYTAPTSVTNFGKE